MTAPYNPRTPGIQVREVPAFPPAVGGVPTAVPAFLGYTEFAVQGIASATLTPVLITSMADYQAFFGGAPSPRFRLSPAADSASTDVTLGGQGYALQIAPGTRLHLYHSLHLYFLNGGGPCYIVSVGSYAKVASDGMKVDDFLAGLGAVADSIGPTVLLAPDAVLLAPDAGTKDAPVDPAAPYSTDYATFAAAAAKQAWTQKDRMVLLDVYGADRLHPTPATLANTLSTFIDKFRETTALDQDYRSYAAAYFPFLSTNLIAGADLGFSAFDLTGEAIDPSKPAPAPAKPDPKAPAAPGGGLAALQRALAAEADAANPNDPVRASLIKTKMIAKISAAMTVADARHVNQALTAALPNFAQVYEAMAAQLSVLPPSGAIAGAYVTNDATRGVWEAPANMPLVGVVRPTIAVSDALQEDLNAPLEGMAINCIRSLPGRGHLVWGARTLDANSNDFRYVQVRRALIFLETSIKIAMNRFVFEGNVDQTWASVTAMISSFLNDVWSQGGLMGLKPNEAYSVQCGRTLTMTGDDILKGRMIVNVMLSLVHPAEFILLKFQQQMGGATTA